MSHNFHTFRQGWSTALVIFLIGGVLLTVSNIRTQHEIRTFERAQAQYRLSTCDYGIKRNERILAFWDDTVRHENNLVRIWNTHAKQFVQPAISDMTTQIALEEAAIATATKVYRQELAAIDNELKISCRKEKL